MIILKNEGSGFVFVKSLLRLHALMPAFSANRSSDVSPTACHYAKAFQMNLQGKPDAVPIKNSG